MKLNPSVLKSNLYWIVLYFECNGFEGLVDHIFHVVEEEMRILGREEIEELLGSS